MNYSQFSKNYNEEESKERGRRSRRQDYCSKKREFWEKVQEVRFNHRDRTKDQEALGLANNQGTRVPLNQQMGFKSRLKIGKSNPSKRTHESKAQRDQFDKHEDGTTCIQGDSMEFKKLIDLTEVQCKGFDKIIYAKKGWRPVVTRMTTIVCCPSTRTKLEKALVRRYDDRRKARRRGEREYDLWSELQHKHSKEINQEWKHFDLIPGNHIADETIEMTSNLIEEVQFNQRSNDFIILPPIVVNDKGIESLERVIETTNYKLENGRFWRSLEDISGMILPVCCQGSIKNCQNWTVWRIMRDSKTLEVYDSRTSVGSLAVIQKSTRQLNELMEGTLGKRFWLKRIEGKTGLHQVRDPEDCGILAILTINHLALDLQGNPYSKSLPKIGLTQVGSVRMEIGKSGITIQEDELKRDIERKNELIWQHADEDLENGSITFNAQVDQWDEVILRGDIKAHIENEIEDCEGKFSELVGDAPEVESYFFNRLIQPNSDKPENQTEVIDQEKEELPFAQGDDTGRQEKGQEQTKTQIEDIE
ncbi:hypothetical protein OXYTRIMIC_301 [Oxytricha trifallax]|uniref:Ubiquitin-like protease family profile domain-containing protein n=1 Tax=Oxytricha trifallax TaxID=1172189 RepID=A0A073HZJ5_9SPIT|nr:hypothetical protein OXYTRIMIC_301 [Oxytricha trifallax]